MEAKVVYMKDTQPTDLGGGVTRSVLAYNEEIMMVEICFEAGAKIAVHAHPHVQCSRVMAGRFCFTVGGEPVEVGAGDSIAVPSGVPHGVECLEAGKLTEVFTPMRKDFV